MQLNLILRNKPYLGLHLCAVGTFGAARQQKSYPFLYT